MRDKSRINLLDGDWPKDLKNLEENELELLSYEIRDFLIEHISKTGGHLASNLGVVELTIALHKVFDCPEDKIVWDVGHQSYVHKILTGRADRFDSLRQLGGISGFPKREESPYDAFDTGHSSTSISAALGMATARDLNRQRFSVVAVIGDGALTGGLSFEALNNLGASQSKVIAIVNDNGMSISPNIGGISKHLTNLRISAGYQDFKKQLKKTLKRIPMLGEGLYAGAEHFRDALKSVMLEGGYFEELGIKYLGPFDGHNISELTTALNLAKNMDSSVVLHVLTQKGKGYPDSEKQPDKFHGIAPFNPNTGEVIKASAGISYSQAFGNKMIEIAEYDPYVTCVCAAMINGTGLENFHTKYPERCFDVGIAEAHAVSFAAGQAAMGLKPVVAIYSTFLQRAYDQIMIDVCMQDLPVIFAIDRAGNVGEDGETHHGVYDISYLSHIPNMNILSPTDVKELELMLEYAISLGKPCSIRYPRGDAPDLSELYMNDYGPIEKNKEIFSDGEILVYATGRMVLPAYTAVERLRKEGKKVALSNIRSIKPLDIESLSCDSKKFEKFVSVEDNVFSGGMGSMLTSFFQGKGVHKDFLILSWPDRFVEHGNSSMLFKKYSLDAEGVYQRVSEFIER